MFGESHGVWLRADNDGRQHDKNARFSDAIGRIGPPRNMYGDATEIRAHIGF
ncbi:hypothetical protein HSR122_2422 [Halapricum desulfuricans]|uniref:Uncharacterized protein n=1 Tax=Halapricum desulfuricans TaxID=2841257 RepID=A0A897NFW7_9EURY|nr:hypothetical protein HSR122_2422 [Halapricum desulfuricans]